MTSSTKAVNVSRSNMAINDSAPVNKRMEHRYMLHLGKQCYLFDSNFRDTIYIHIRELAFRDNQPLPTAKGIALTLLKCNELYTYLHITISNRLCKYTTYSLTIDKRVRFYFNAILEKDLSFPH